MYVCWIFIALKTNIILFNIYFDNAKMLVRDHIRTGKKRSPKTFVWQRKKSEMMRAVDVVLTHSPEQHWTPIMYLKKTTSLWTLLFMDTQEWAASNLQPSRAHQRDGCTFPLHLTVLFNKNILQGLNLHSCVYLILSGLTHVYAVCFCDIVYYRHVLLRVGVYITVPYT